MNSCVQRLALWSSVMIIVLGVVSKLPNLLKSRLVYEENDPILALPQTCRDATIVLLEVCALAWLWLTRSKPVQQGLSIMLLGGLFVMYHVALGIANISGPCPCFGSALRILGLPEQIATVMTATFAWLLFNNGLVLLTWSSLK